jgi:hypothetical protein
MTVIEFRIQQVIVIGQLFGGQVASKMTKRKIYETSEKSTKVASGSDLYL